MIWVEIRIRIEMCSIVTNLVVLDNRLDDKLGGFEGVRADERIQFNVGVFKFDQRQSQFTFNRFQFWW